MNTIRRTLLGFPLTGIVFAVAFILMSVFFSSCDKKVKNEVVNIKCNHDKDQVVVPLENILAHIENHLSGGHEHE